MTLLSSIGVQELELFGDHGLNHSVHAVQLGLLWLAREGLRALGAYRRVFPIGSPRYLLWAGADAARRGRPR